MLRSPLTHLAVAEFLLARHNPCKHGFCACFVRHFNYLASPNNLIRSGELEQAPLSTHSFQLFQLFQSKMDTHIQQDENLNIKSD